jgi:hypothetical protein
VLAAKKNDLDEVKEQTTVNETERNQLAKENKQKEKTKIKRAEGTTTTSLIRTRKLDLGRNIRRTQHRNFLGNRNEANRIGQVISSL